MIERFIQLIHEYQSRVREAVELFEGYKGLKQPQHPLEWQLSGIPQRGYLDPSGKISYFFHGYGCCVCLPSGQVDWDFGREGQIDGFDVWRLSNFVEKGTQNFPEFRDEKLIKAMFAEAESKGLFHKSDYVLYYLKQ
ncbi:DUF6896 domain-containing protein [Trichocoleus sp. FACHB-262]|uniref:DUF6896 domain-containing protein n=1 Tax=Trichocoleus sp. FACHB-262 TaxID=2692869 RepID=UPI0016872BD7|nr:hypothetical protein [Trichocoleus sp. FACHB-262]MBD2123618.1 hypothetical protein [Trichocoleus sp. FACHB-262]